MKVSNTGPLIVLHETSLLWLLKELYTEIIIPKAVQLELLKKSDGHFQIHNHGYYLDQELINEILKRAGEIEL